MVVVVSCDGLEVAPYFTQTTSFMVYTVDLGIITECKNLPAQGLDEASLGEMFKAIKADTLIVGHIDCATAVFICGQKIEVVANAEGSALDVTKAYISQSLTGVLDACFLCDETDDLEPDNTKPKSI